MRSFGSSSLYLIYMENYYSGCFGNEMITFHFKYGRTNELFGSYLTQALKSEDAVEVRDYDFREFEDKWDLKSNDYTEFILSAYRCTDQLLKNKSCLYHGAAFLWKGKAFLFTAASGTGKSTQLRNWKNLYPEEITVLNGDKPILKAEGSQIIVYPSPWKGKERWGRDDISAPLGGIIYLVQAKENRIRRMKVSEAVQPLLKRILSTFETEEIAINAGKFEDLMLKSTPVWLLENTGDASSAELTHKTLLNEVFANEI